jgi:hypothetical protein
VTTIEPRRAIIPGPAPSPEAGSHDSPGQPVEARRRTTRLDADYYASRGAARRNPAPAPEAPPAPARTVLRLAERVLGDWAPTLRASIVVAVAFLALAGVLVLTFGWGGAPLAVGLGIALRGVLRDR